MNAGIQGLAADIFKVALVRLDQALVDGGVDQPARPAGARRGAGRGARGRARRRRSAGDRHHARRRPARRAPGGQRLLGRRPGPTPRADVEPTAERQRRGALVRADRRPSRVGVPAVLVHEGHGQEVDHIVEALGLQPGMRVLDVGCGPGRHAHELARRGIVGARHRHLPSGSSTWPRRDAPPGATFERLDARALPFDAEFDAVICLCQGAFGLMTADGDDRMRASTGMAAALSPAGGWRSSAFNAYFAVKYHEDGDVRRRPAASATSAPRCATSRGAPPRSTCGPAATRRASCACCCDRPGFDVDSHLQRRAGRATAPTADDRVT